ncbi:ATP-grasp domain-containing protein [Candidatus Bathyarchaeota archaeon]|nr:ATP-grasp domain-containing protein [Candidatus Bathyarchaeota archaeon]
MTTKCNKEQRNTDIIIGVLFNTPVEPLKGEKIDFIADAEVKEVTEAVQKALEKLDFKYQMIPFEMDFEVLVKTLKHRKPNVIINLCEGAYGDSHQEMNIPAVLEILKIPYTGSSPLTLGICQNKRLTKEILRANRLPTPNYTVLENFSDWKGEIGFPLFVKPFKEDASIGISSRSYVRNDAELKAQVDYINNRYKQPALVEEYVAGRELNVSILGNENPIVLPISEITFDFPDEPKIVDFSAKWLKESEQYKRTRLVCQALLPAFVKNEIEKIALLAYKSLYCRDYARIDIRLRENQPLILEANPNPDIAPDAGFVRSLRAAGISYEQFIEKIVYFALQRGSG